MVYEYKNETIGLELFQIYYFMLTLFQIYYLGPLYKFIYKFMK